MAAVRKAEEAVSWTRVRKWNQEAQEKRRGADFPPPWPIVSFLSTLSCPPAQNPLSESLLDSFCLPPPQQPLWGKGKCRGVWRRRPWAPL